MFWSMYIYGRILHKGNCHFERVCISVPDAVKLDDIFAAEAVAPVADVMAPLAARGSGEEFTAVRAPDLLGLVKVFQIASADQAAGLVGHRYRMGKVGDKGILKNLFRKTVYPTSLQTSK